MNNSEFEIWLKETFGQNKIKLILSILCSIARSIVLFLPAILTKVLIDQIIPNENYIGLVSLNIVSVFIYILVTTLIIADLNLNKYILDSFSKLRTALYRNFLYRTVKEFEGVKTGESINKIVDETEALADFVYFGIGNIVWINSTVILGMILMMYQNFDIAILVILAMIIRVVAVRKVSKPQANVYNSLYINNSNISQLIKEQTTNMLLIKASANENKELCKVDELLNYKIKLQLEIYINNIKNDLVYTLVEIIINLIFYLYGAIQISNGSIVAGTLVALVTLYEWILPALSGYINLHIDFLNRSNLVKRIFELFVDISEEKKDRDKIPQNIDIMVKDLSFSYNTDNVLDNICFCANKGELTILIGESGTGKSTLAEVLANIKTDYTGNIYIGEVLLNRISKKWIANNIILVNQDGYLMNKSIKDNILFGMEHYTERDFQKVLKITSLDIWLNSLPKKEDTIITDKALNISGGERQRILLARALLRRAKIYIFDESTSALDILTERSIVKKIKEYYPNSVLLMITHKDTCNDLCDKKYKLTGGECYELNSNY